MLHLSWSHPLALPSDKLQRLINRGVRLSFAKMEVTHVNIYPLKHSSPQTLRNGAFLKTYYVTWQYYNNNKNTKPTSYKAKTNLKHTLLSLTLLILYDIHYLTTTTSTPICLKLWIWGTPFHNIHGGQ